MHKWVHYFKLSNKMGKWKLIIIWQQATFHQKKSSWVEIQFAKCKDFLCIDVWVATHPKTGQRNDFREHRSKATFFFLTTHKTVTHKLLQSLRSSFCIGMCWWPHEQREDFHLLQTGLSLWSLLLFVIFTFSGTQRQGKYWHFFGLSDIGSQVSFLVQCLKLKLGARTSEGSLSAIFSILLFESLSHSYLSAWNTCVAVLLVANCFSWTKTVRAEELLKRNKILGPV